MKLDVPHFDGQDPLGWIFKITQFVDYQAVLGNKCLTVASFYMEGLTLCWYQWMSWNGFLTSWPAMLQALESRFTPSFYDGSHEALFKLMPFSWDASIRSSSRSLPGGAGVTTIVLVANYNACQTPRRQTSWPPIVPPNSSTTSTYFFSNGPCSKTNNRSTQVTCSLLVTWGVGRPPRWRPLFPLW